MDYENIFDNSEEVLVVRKELVRALGGLNEAIVLNQLHYWLQINEKNGCNNHDGHFWVYSTYEAWQERDFDFWSVTTIKRLLLKLEKMGVVVVARYNKSSYNNTKWYTIDYEVLEKLVDKSNKKNDKGGKGKGLKSLKKQAGPVEQTKLTRSRKETRTENKPTSSTTLNNCSTTLKDSVGYVLQPLNDILTFREPSKLNDIYTYAPVGGLDELVNNYIDSHSTAPDNAEVVAEYSINPCDAPKAGFTKYTGMGRGFLKIFKSKGIGTSDWRFKTFLPIVEYFLGKAPKNSKYDRLGLSERQLEQMVDSYLYEWDDEYSEAVYDLDSYKKLIDAYLDTNYGRGISKSIMHFFAGKIRVNLAYKVLV